MAYDHETADRAHRIVRVLTLGLEGQRMTRLMGIEFETRLQAILEGDPSAGLGPLMRGPDGRDEREPQETGETAPVLVAQAIAAATAGLARPRPRDLLWRETGISTGELSYSGRGCPGWAATVEAVGRRRLAGRVSELVNCGTNWYGCRAWFGGRGRRGTTLVVEFS